MIRKIEDVIETIHDYKHPIHIQGVRVSVKIRRNDTRAHLKAITLHAPDKLSDTDAPELKTVKPGQTIGVRMKLDLTGMKGDRVAAGKKRKKTESKEAITFTTEVPKKLSTGKYEVVLEGSGFDREFGSLAEAMESAFGFGEGHGAAKNYKELRKKIEKQASYDGLRMEFKSEGGVDGDESDEPSESKSNNDEENEDEKDDDEASYHRLDEAAPHVSREVLDPSTRTAGSE